MYGSWSHFFDQIVSAWYMLGTGLGGYWYYNNNPQHDVLVLMKFNSNKENRSVNNPYLQK